MSTRSRSSASTFRTLWTLLRMHESAASHLDALTLCLMRLRALFACATMAADLITTLLFANLGPSERAKSVGSAAAVSGVLADLRHSGIVRKSSSALKPMATRSRSCGGMLASCVHSLGLPNPREGSPTQCAKPRRTVDTYLPK